MIIRLLTKEEVADVLRLNARYVAETLIRTGEIPAVKLGGQWRVKEDALAQWIAQKEIESRNLVIEKNKKAYADMKFAEKRKKDEHDH